MEAVYRARSKKRCFKRYFSYCLHINLFFEMRGTTAGLISQWMIQWRDKLMIKERKKILHCCTVLKEVREDGVTDH